VSDYNTQMIRLLNALIERTASGAVRWQVVSDHSFGIETPSGAVLIEPRDNDDRPPFTLNLFDQGHRLIDSLQTEWFNEDDPFPWNTPLSELFYLARASAFNVDEVSAKILSDLDEENYVEWGLAQPNVQSYAFDEEPF